MFQPVWRSGWLACVCLLLICGWGHLRGDDGAQPVDAASQENSAERETPEAGDASQVLPPQADNLAQFFPFQRAWRFRGPLPVANSFAEEDKDEEPEPGIVLADNGDLRRRLEQIRQELAGERYADATRLLGLLLQNPETQDFFLSRDEARRGGRSFLTELRRMIVELPPAGLAAYRAQFEAPARLALAEALRAGGEAPLRDVVRRYPATPSGATALYRLGHLLCDRGRPAAALGCFLRLQADAELSTAFEPQLSLRVAACAVRTGRSDVVERAAQALLKHPLSAQLKIAGHDVQQALQAGPGAVSLTKLFGPPGAPQYEADSDWPMFRGDGLRNHHVAAAAPLVVPRWTSQLTSDPRTQLALERGEQTYRDRQKTQLPQLCPLAVGNQVLVRTARGVAAYDVETGKCNWRFPSDDDGANVGFDDRWWREPAGGGLAADDERVYLLEGDTVVVTGDDETPTAGTNTLVACEHSTAREGKLCWRVGGIDGEDEPRLAGARFLGAPLARQGRLYVLLERQRTLHLAVLDTQRGRLEWMQELALVDDEPDQAAFRLLAGASPSISEDDIILCPTSGGALVAVDLTMQSLLWAYRYPRQSAASETASTEGAVRLSSQGRWLDGTALIAGDAVVLAPAESPDLHCLSLAEGSPLWTRPRGAGLFVAAVTGEAIVVAGAQTVSALRLADGEPAWQAPFTLPEGVLTAGWGVFAQNRYFLPTTAAAILEVDLASGQLVATHRSPRETDVGNLVWHRGTFFSQGPIFLQAFEELGPFERRLQARLSQAPDDAKALLDRGELALVAGRHEDALADFRRSVAIDATPRGKSLLTAGLLEALRRNGADRGVIEGELDRLAERP